MEEAVKWPEGYSIKRQAFRSFRGNCYHVITSEKKMVPQHEGWKIVFDRNLVFSSRPPLVSSCPRGWRWVVGFRELQGTQCSPWRSDPSDSCTLKSAAPCHIILHCVPAKSCDRFYFFVRQTFRQRSCLLQRTNGTMVFHAVLMSVCAPLLPHCFQGHGRKQQCLTMEQTSTAPQIRRVEPQRQRRMATEYKSSSGGGVGPMWQPCYIKRGMSRGTDVTIHNSLNNGNS